MYNRKVCNHMSRIATVTTSRRPLDGLGPSQWGGMAMLEVTEAKFPIRKVPDCTAARRLWSAVSQRGRGPSLNNCIICLWSVTLQKYVYVYALVVSLFI